MKKFKEAARPVHCPGPTYPSVFGRRSFIQVGMLGGLGLGLADLFATLGQDRERFERELTRLAEMTFAAVVVEADWDKILKHPPEFSRLNPKTIFRSVIAWQQRYPRVHWWMGPDRRFAEIVTLRILERFLKEQS